MNFPYISSDDCQKLFSNAIILKFLRNEVIYREGDVPYAVYINKSGNLSVTLI